jgi:hypothetical protein
MMASLAAEEKINAMGNARARSAFVMLPLSLFPYA